MLKQPFQERQFPHRILGYSKTIPGNSLFQRKLIKHYKTLQLSGGINFPNINLVSYHPTGFSGCCHPLPFPNRLLIPPGPGPGDLRLAVGFSQGNSWVPHGAQR